MINIKRIQTFVLLGGLFALATVHSADSPPSTSHQHQDLLAIRHDLQSLEIEVAQLENQLTALKAQQSGSIEQDFRQLPSGGAANELELAIQTLLKDVTEQ